MKYPFQSKQSFVVNVNVGPAVRSKEKFTDKAVSVAILSDTGMPHTPVHIVGCVEWQDRGMAGSNEGRIIRSIQRRYAHESSAQQWDSHFLIGTLYRQYPEYKNRTFKVVMWYN
jgi:hypothetical protein